MLTLAVASNLAHTLTVAWNILSRHPSIMFLLASMLLLSAASFVEKLGQRTSSPNNKLKSNMESMDESSYEV